MREVGLGAHEAQLHAEGRQEAKRQRAGDDRAPHESLCPPGVSSARATAQPAVGTAGGGAASAELAEMLPQLLASREWSVERQLQWLAAAHSSADAWLSPACDPALTASFCEELDARRKLAQAWASSLQRLQDRTERVLMSTQDGTHGKVDAAASCSIPC
ncbi:hypothetical protein AB1Y20_012432 [Prymnesium parvum]|uniref:Uncharacterized protein n=1 Tax=Prymnesium parvum TaxID=97485 RepID=A0AB34IKN3_PRYPA